MTERADTIYKFRYKQSVEKLLADIQRNYDDGTIESHLGQLRQRLDWLMTRYQEDETLGSLRSTLYEAQAYLQYLSGDARAALKSMRRAVKLRGEHFDDSVKLQKLIKGDHLGVAPAHPVRSARSQAHRKPSATRGHPMKLRTNKVSTLGVPVTIAVLLAATAGGTYWVVIRPHSIQAHCNAFATEASQHPPTSHVIFVKQMENTNYTSEYQECLRQHGL